MRESWICLVLFFGISAGSTEECQPDQFACAGGGCVPAIDRCDHVTDCDDGSDEIHCDFPCRNPHMRPCANGHCVAAYFFCDDKNDCGDWSDEANCTVTQRSSMNKDAAPKKASCPSNTFQCSDMCIPISWVCDGTHDCADGRDELRCDTNATSCTNGFKCGKECILEQWVCDGETDCLDGSDERECGPDLNHICLPEHGWFSCINRGVKKCMPISRACDGYQDCDDQSDEGGLCSSSTNCDAKSSKCIYGCNKTPGGPVCKCPLGFRSNGTSCVDINECNISPPVCSQICQNTLGGFHCSCIPGYKLHSNNHSCVAYGPEPVLLVATNREIRSLGLTSKEYGLVQSTISQAQSLAADYEDKFVYWAEKSADKAGIFKSLIDGSAHQTVVSYGIESVEDMAIDWVGRHIYFTDSGTKHIAACDLHGTLCTVVITGDLDQPRAIAVYPENRLLFWTDWGTRAYIGSAGMDGSDRKEIVSTDIVWPNGLVVDETIHRIFWCDGKLNRIESSRVDGSDRTAIPVAVEHPFSIEVFQSSIYWSDPVNHEVHSFDKFTGKSHQVLMKEVSLSPTGIHIHHPSKQRHMMNPCWDVICSHLCLLSPCKDSYRCACPAGMTLNKDNRTCDPGKRRASIIIATYTNLFQLTDHQIGKDSFNRIPSRNIDNLGVLAFNPLGHSIIYSDLGRKAILSMHLETYKETVLFDNVSAVEGLDVDPYTENIYWTEVDQGKLMVGRMLTGDRLVLGRDLSSPKAIALAPELGLMFIIEGRIGQVISVRHMDGGWRQDLAHVYGTVSSMVYDKKMLYFCDAVRGTIERIGVDGRDRVNLRSHLGSPIALSVGIDSIFWLTQYSNRLNWISKKDSKMTRGFIIDASDDFSVEYRKLAVVDHFDYADQHVCLGHTGGCSDFCAPTPQGAKCLCPLGMELAPNQRLCRQVDCVGDEWFKCTNSCIPMQMRCDGVADCALGEDEAACKAEEPATVATCFSHQFSCENGGCIPAIYVCDGDADCQDKSDEPSTCPAANCTADEFRCADGKHCLPRSILCDGQRDCADGSDEPANCSSTLEAHCSSSQFYCQQSRLCIPQNWVCDKDDDCEFGEDEKNCYAAATPCLEHYVRCPGHGECLPKITLCGDSGLMDCESKSDAELCANLNKSYSRGSREEDVAAEESCPPDQFTCFLGTRECVPITDRCNCVFNCHYGEDEEGCSPCGDGSFRCPGEMRFISTSWVCDGVADCSSGADELPALCRISSQPNLPDSVPAAEPVACGEDDFKCKSGECISFNWTCDSSKDCFDGTDEGRNCSTSCLNNGHCPQICVPGPDGARCRCNPGFKSLDNGHQCEDIDECEVEDPCSQMCTNTKGGYKCSCARGYELEQDQRTCKVIEGRPFLLISSDYYIDTMFNEEEMNQLLYSPLVIKDVAFHNKDSTLYFLTSEGVNWASNIRSSLIYKISNMSPSGLALDEVTGNVYVSGAINSTGSTDRSIIKVFSPAANADLTIVQTSTLITDIAIDNRQGVLFWSEHTKPHSGRMYRSLMDGTLPRWLHSVDKIVYPVGLALDSIKRRLYWADLRLQSISSCDYDGNRQRMVVSNTNGLPRSVSFFENKVMWTNLDQKKIYTQMLNSHGLISTTFERVSHVLSVHSILEANLANSCQSAPCGNGLCVLKSSETFTCFCPAGAAVVSLNPFACQNETVSLPDDPAESVASPGVTVGSILICLTVLTVLALLGWVYYKRWRRAIGSPLKLRFRTALGLSEESTAWDEGIGYSDRKMLYPAEEEDDDSVSSHVDDQLPSQCPADSAYASHSSLVKNKSGEAFPQQLLPSSYSMKDQLLDNEY